MADQAGNAFTVAVLDTDTIIQLTVADNDLLQHVTVTQRPDGTPIGGNYNAFCTRVFYPKTKFQELLAYVRVGYENYEEANEAGQVVHVQVVYTAANKNPVTDFICNRPASTRGVSRMLALTAATSQARAIEELLSEATVLSKTLIGCRRKCKQLLNLLEAGGVPPNPSADKTNGKRRDASA